MASKKFVKEDGMSEAEVTRLWANQGFGMTPRGLYDYAMGDNAAGHDVMEVALNGLAKNVREVKDTAQEHGVTLEEHAEAIAELGGSVQTKGAEAKASLTVSELQSIRDQLDELLAFRSAQEQEISALRQRAADAEAEAEARRAADATADAAAADAAADGGVPDLATLAQQMEELRLQLAEQQKVNEEQAAKLQEIMGPHDPNNPEAPVPPWINYDASAKPTSAKPSSRDGVSRGGSSMGSRGGSRPGRSGGGLGLGDSGGLGFGADPVLQGPDGPVYEGDRPFSVAGAAESLASTPGARVDASKIGPTFNSVAADTTANARDIKELMGLKDSIEQAVTAAASATSQTAAVAMQGASLKAQLMAIATEMHGQKERIVALEGGGKGPTLADTQHTLANLSAKAEENFAQLQQLLLDVARLQGRQERARTPWGTNAVLAPGTPLAQAMPTVSKAESGLAAAMASGDPVAVASAQADLAKSRASASEAEVAEAESSLVKAAAEKAEAEAAVAAAVASGDPAAVAAAEAKLAKAEQEAKVAEQAKTVANAQAELERTTMVETQAAMDREIQSRGGTAGTHSRMGSRMGSSRGVSSGGDGGGMATENLRTGELALLKLDGHQQEMEEKMAAETEARAAAFAKCEAALQKLESEVGGMRGNLQQASESLREKAEQFDMHKLEVSMLETMELIHMLAGRGSGASQAEATIEMHREERARMEEMIAEHGEQLNALFSASASKDDVDAAANLVAEMDRKLAAEMEAKAADLMKKLEEHQEVVQKNVSELSESVAGKADVEWSQAMEAKIRADIAASTDSEEMKHRRLKRQLKTLHEKTSMMGGASMRDSGTWRSYHAIFNRCLACNNPLEGADASWQTRNVANKGMSGAPGFGNTAVAAVTAADGLGVPSASHTQNRSSSPVPKRGPAHANRIPMKEDHAEVIMKGGFPMANPKAKQKAKLDRAKQKAGEVAGLTLSGMGGAT